VARVEVHTLSDIAIQLEDDWWVQRYHRSEYWWNVFHFHEGVLCATYYPYVDNNTRDKHVKYKCCTNCGDKVPTYVMGFVELLRWRS